MPTTNEKILLVGLIISMIYIIWQHIVVQVLRKELDNSDKIEWKELKEDYK